MEYKLPLRNKKKEIVGYTYISEEDYEILSQFKFHKTNHGGYARGAINNKQYLLHRYIMIEILGNDIDSSIKIDHTDNNPLNNKRDNLQIVTNSENARNKTKKQNTYSQYIGVC